MILVLNACLFDESGPCRQWVVSIDFFLGVTRSKRRFDRHRSINNCVYSSTRDLSSPFHYHYLASTVGTDRVFPPSSFRAFFYHYSEVSFMEGISGGDGSLRTAECTSLSKNDSIPLGSGNPEGGIEANVVTNAANVASTIEENPAPVHVPVRKGKRKVPDREASSKPPVEKKFSGSGPLSGYILKMDFKEKEESSYDFSDYSWVDPSIMETSSVYRSSEETVAFAEEYDFVRKDFNGIIECSWCSDDDMLCSRPSADDIRPMGPTHSLYNGLLDEMQSLMSTRPSFWNLRYPKFVFLENRVPLKCTKLIELEGEPEKLKKYIVKMSPKLDKAAMARRIAEKKKEAARVKDELAVSGEVKSTEQLIGSEALDAGKWIETSTNEVSRKRRKGDANEDVHNISDDENRSENVIDVFQEFVGSSPEIRSLWDTCFEFGNMIDVACSPPGDQSQLEKWGPRSAQVMLQIQGIHSTFLGRYLELQYVKGLSDVEVLRKRITDLEKDLSGTKKLRAKVVGLEEHVSIFYPDVDTSVCNVLKEAVDGVLVDLVNGDGESRVELTQTDALVETVTGKVVFADDGGVATDVLGDAPCT
ncbi:hypothetical protein SESBI_24032 [Sesbania bispinosa]|nr:hypothetical protein SESBI_24032 [Sesbania bispinosa]